MSRRFSQRASLFRLGSPSTAEQLVPDQVERITSGFGVPPANSFGSTEGLTGLAPPGSEAFTFASDRVVIEFVDAEDNPVPPGTPAHHVLITNLTSDIQPLIRYRMDDSMTELPPAPEHGHQRGTVNGRDDGFLSVGGVTVHPIIIRSALLRHDAINEFQVRIVNYPHGRRARVEIALVAAGPLHLKRVEGDVASALAKAGTEADATATIVDELQRHAATGKIQRFITEVAN